MSGITHIKNIAGIPVYGDQYMDRDSYLVMYEKFWPPPEMIWVPFSKMEEVEAAEIETKRVKEIQKKKKERKLSDVKAIICNCPEEDIDKITKSLYKEFK